ncbi:MAG: hypothetical protein DCC58_00760 [Chloroflexi bacterium]|nr:MAG: hypothetical protein DCC58_00760 [Chloroflexota bacterium]
MPRRPIEINDLYNVKLVADPNISPDGSRVVFVVTTVDKAINGYRSALWMLDIASGEPWQFTSGRKQDSSPRWSPDGTHIAFLSDRNGTRQIWVMPADGGEPWPVTDGPHAASEISWASDSRTLVFTRKVEPAAEASSSDVRVVRSLKYKFDGEGFLDGKRRQVFLVDRDGGRARQVTSGDWDSTQPSLAGDGSRLAFVSNRTDDRESNSLSDIWVADLRTGSLQQVTSSDGTYMTPLWSPDGGRLAYVGHPICEPYGPTTLDDLYVWEQDSGRTTRLLTTLEREPGNSAIADMRYHVPASSLAWSSDSASVYTLVSDAGSIHIYACPLGESPELLVGGARDIQSFTVAADGSVAFASSTMSAPTEVYLLPAGGAEMQASRLNAQLLDTLDLPATEEVRFPSDEGHEVHGWLLRPPGFRPGVRYPAIIQVHGGPHGMYGTGFFHEMHVLAARGYVVLFTNPRGSTGYGQEFVAGTLGDWGGADYRDVMAGADYLASLDYIDPTRMGITGGSYGGYMTNWVIGQTDRFKVAVTQRSTCNRYSLYGTSDWNMMYNDWEFRGAPWDNPELYMERSPITYVKNVRTPLLILHSENDLRCPISQGEELFVALKKLGRDVEFVRFPNESHNLSRSGQPAHRVERLERLCGWFDARL